MTDDPQPIQDWRVPVLAAAERCLARTDRTDDETAPAPVTLGAAMPTAMLNSVTAFENTVPARYTSTIVDHPDVAAWVDGVLAGSDRGLLLLGEPGTGKTYQAFGALRELVAAGMGGLAVTVTELLEAARPNRDPAAVGRAQCAPLLLLDDVGAQRDTDWTAEVLYRVIDYRWAWCLPTLVTSNLPPAELRAVIGDRLASRLAGMCSTVVMSGADRRREAR